MGGMGWHGSIQGVWPSTPYGEGLQIFNTKGEGVTRTEYISWELVFVKLWDLNWTCHVFEGWIKLDIISSGGV